MGFLQCRRAPLHFIRKRLPFLENSSLQDRRVNQFTIHMGAEFDRPIPKVIQKDDSFDENSEVHSYLLSISKLLLAIDDMMDGKYTTWVCV